MTSPVAAVGFCKTTLSYNSNRVLKPYNRFNPRLGRPFAVPEAPPCKGSKAGELGILSGRSQIDVRPAPPETVDPSPCCAGTIPCCLCNIRQRP